MPSLTAKDRVSLCLFSYEDGRRCRTPRIASHPHFCFYHAQKESQSQATEKLAKDLTYFFSGDYLSANDLNTALGRLIPAVIRGEIKSRVARTVAYMLQTLLQSSRQAQHEYINAFDTDAWRKAIANSVNSNHSYLHPPKPKQRPQSPVPQTPVGAGPVYTACPVYPEPRREERREPRSSRPAAPAAPPASSTGPNRTTATPIQSPPPTRPSPADTEAALQIARSIFPDRSTAPQSQPTNAPPPAPPPQPPTPPRDPFEQRFPHTAFRVDGKPW